MKKYLIEYCFNGKGEVEIEATSEKHAYDLFFEGQFSHEQETGEDYEITYIQPVSVCKICEKTEDGDGRCGCVNKDAF